MEVDAADGHHLLYDKEWGIRKEVNLIKSLILGHGVNQTGLESGSKITKKLTPEISVTGDCGHFSIEINARS